MLRFIAAQAVVVDDVEHAGGFCQGESVRDYRIFSALIVASEEHFVREELPLDAYVYDSAILPTAALPPNVDAI